MNIRDLKKTILDMDMDLEELIFERMSIDYEELLDELEHIIHRKRENFEDIERNAN